MTVKRKPKCFVAIAFDRADTDALYEGTIARVLHSEGATPVIINRRQSNDDLNNQIIRALESSDFCIADLTYARPSVYFEAGFAQRAGPVIYTVRADHLARGQPDHLRVHFDLQMKPLLLWRNPTDASFRSKLALRLRATVLREWVRRREAEDKFDQERQRFQSLSVARRLVVLRERAMHAFSRQGYKKWLIAGTSNDPSESLEVVAKYQYPVMAEVRKGRQVRVAVVAASESFTMSALRAIELELRRQRFQYGVSNLSSDAVHFEVLLLSLRPLPTSRIERVFDSYERSPNGGFESTTAPVHAGKRTSPTVIVRIRVVGPIASEEELTSALRKATKGMRGPAA